MHYVQEGKECPCEIVTEDVLVRTVCNVHSQKPLRVPYEPYLLLISVPRYAIECFSSPRDLNSAQCTNLIMGKSESNSSWMIKKDMRTFDARQICFEKSPFRVLPGFSYVFTVYFACSHCAICPR